MTLRLLTLAALLGATACVSALLEGAESLAVKAEAVSSSAAPWGEETRRAARPELCKKVSDRECDCVVSEVEARASELSAQVWLLTGKDDEVAAALRAARERCGL